MTYFRELHEAPTYPSQGPDFRFTYNYNSGGGNSFLAGKPVDASGQRTPAITLDGKQAVFVFKFDATEHQPSVITLDDDDVKYDIKPRGTGSQQMKLGVGHKPNPSRAVQAFLMLPEGCGTRKSAHPEWSVLSTQNYWLHEMRLDWIDDPSQRDVAFLSISEPVFGSMSQPAGRIDNTSGGDIEPEERYFTIDIEQRIAAVIRASENETLPTEIREPLQSFAAIYSGTHKFVYAEARKLTAALMAATAHYYPLHYGGVGDPLPVLEQGTVSSVAQGPRFRTGLPSPESRNRIVFGAPGTGKSHKLDEQKDLLLADGGTFQRVTFHPDYTYASFVGTYKPVPVDDGQGSERITYKYVPGPFMRVIAEALRNGRTDDVKPHLLLIEEINRAPAAAVFGDVFQLLDRNHDNSSQYPIQCSVDMQNFLSETVGGKPADYRELRIPDNMFIWGSMNSADQGVFPIDTAFKRRWDFTYIGINDNDEELRGNTVTLGTGAMQRTVEWNALRKAINDFLAAKGVNEDKQIGPYFLSRQVSIPDAGQEIEPGPFGEAFKQKVIMYLFEDAARQHRSSLFEGCNGGHNRYSEICQEFDTKGVHIFNQDVIAKVPDVAHWSQQNGDRDPGDVLDG